MKNRYLLSIAFIFIFWISPGFYVSAQSQGGTTSQNLINIPGMDANQNENVMLARSSADYRVTPGDVYTLAYAAGITSVSYIILVDTSYRIRVSNLGIVNGAGKTFMQLKSEVESVVANNYPLSGVQLVLTQPAIFKVYVMGEVQTAGEVSAWGLSRLSALVEKGITNYASIRDITVKSSNGQTRVYDLFKALRLGDLSQDPYLRPGDVVTFNRIKRFVTIDGEVERPGGYQLLEGENIKELIEFYGSGFTPTADKASLELVRLINGVEISGNKIFLTEDDLQDYALENYDKVTVPRITQLQPVMFVEGAIVDAGQQSLDDTGGRAISTMATSQNLVASNRKVVPFNKGETYASVVRKNINWFTAVSDTQNAYIIRNNEQIPINLTPILYDAFYHSELLIDENDVLVIPFRQYFVTVVGAVYVPGRYPYIPDRNWEYYIALAGGFIKELNFNKAIVITDV
ncbi:MAG: SLBB domain-containing protein, partial [Treponema sp.]|nr:SLBB domain-containing protein [Treponema sp.]